jgi:urease accessory protein
MEKTILPCSGKNKLRVLALAAAAFTTPAFAHTGDHAISLSAGFAHPFSGFDHLLAMLAVGIWAAQHKRAALWVLPLVFPLMMALGALIGVAGMRLPGMEAGIAGSVAVLGLLIAFAVRMPVWAAAAVVSLFALMHGYAHGAELPQGALPVLYGAGFVAATILLHLIGIALVRVAGEPIAQKMVRTIGGTIAAVGAYMLTAVVY